MRASSCTRSFQCACNPTGYCTDRNHCPIGNPRSYRGTDHPTHANRSSYCDAYPGPTNDC